MTRSKDYARFSQFLISLGTGTPQGIPTPEKIESYFMLLEDMDFETVKANAIYAVRKKGFFPMISDIRREAEARNFLEAEADKAFRIIETILERYFWPGYGESFSNIAKDKLSEMGRPDLLPLLLRWGGEIYSGTNPSATRAQFLKSFQIEHGEYQSLPPVDQTEISDKITALLNPVLEKSEV